MSWNLGIFEFSKFNFWKYGYLCEGEFSLSKDYWKSKSVYLLYYGMGFKIEILLNKMKEGCKIFAVKKAENFGGTKLERNFKI